MKLTVDLLFDPPSFGNDKDVSIAHPADGRSAKSIKKPRVIGKGTFSTVLRLKGNAVKVVGVRHSQMLEREYKMLKRLEGCRNIVRAFNVSHRQGKESFLVMEDGGRDIFDALPYLSADDKVFTYLQVSHALEYMHERNVVHLDLKIDNVVIDAARRVRIVDFGLARLLTTEECTTRTLSDIVGSPSYACPEMLRAHTYNGFEADSWSMGVFVFVLWHNSMMWITAATSDDARFAAFEKYVAAAGADVLSSTYLQRYEICRIAETPAWVWHVVNAALVIDPERRRRRWSTSLGATIGGGRDSERTPKAALRSELDEVASMRCSSGGLHHTPVTSSTSGGCSRLPSK
jgi:serine/threonine protein kinase